MSVRKNLFFLCIYCITSCPAGAVIKLPRLIRDSMILQRDAVINIWGWGAQGENVTISWNDKTYKTKTGSDGNWKLQLEPMKAGGPYTMEISGRNKINLRDILIGDVWVCAGQSNMEHQLKLHALKYGDEIAQANYPGIRQFKVPNKASLTGPQDDVNGGSWKWADSANVKDFSAVAFFFARILYEKYHIPIGIINASWGGIPIEAMMSEESLKLFPELINVIEKNRDTVYTGKAIKRALEMVAAIPKNDDKGITEKWFDPSYAPKGWRPIAIPGFWEDQGIRDLNGIVWYRREFTIPASMAALPAKIFLGRIADADEVYINGVRIGATGYIYPQRRYAIPAGLLNKGKNLFVVRITNTSGKGGFVPDKPYQLMAGTDTLDLTGYWSYKVGKVNKLQPDFKATDFTPQYQPAALYNAMLAPLINFTIKGFVWYQGESNTEHPDDYAKMQPVMITDWRDKWKQKNIPFLFTQLPGFMDYNYLPSESQWAVFREAQSKSLSVNNTGMAVTIDLGEWNDIHPDRKREVGERLATAAEKIAYGDNIVYSGPTYQSSIVDGDKIIIFFGNTGGGLGSSDSEPLQEFAISGADKKFVWAKAIVENDKIIVSSNDIPSPKYVRYAWADNPVNPNLVNKEGLPAAPFRTDK